jgi:hypothetical protein
VPDAWPSSCCATARSARTWSGSSRSTSRCKSPMTLPLRQNLHDFRGNVGDSADDHRAGCDWAGRQVGLTCGNSDRQARPIGTWPARPLIIVRCRHGCPRTVWRGPVREARACRRSRKCAAVRAFAVSSRCWSRRWVTLQWWSRGGRSSGW